MLVPRTSRADTDASRGLLTGTAVLLLGFTVGGTVAATANGANGPTSTGWLLMESGFVFAPVAAHGAMGEWPRGLAFAALPAATMGGTVALFEDVPGAVLHGTLVQQRILWGLFGAGLVASAIGVLDVAWAVPRARVLAIAPMLGGGRMGLEVGGPL